MFRGLGGEAVSRNRERPQEITNAVKCGINYFPVRSTQKRGLGLGYCIEHRIPGPMEVVYPHKRQKRNFCAPLLDAQESISSPLIRYVPLLGCPVRYPLNIGARARGGIFGGKQTILATAVS